MKKRDHQSVQYGRGHPHGDHCGICRFWIGGGHCAKVKDPMTFGVNGWCNLYKLAKLFKPNYPQSAK